MILTQEKILELLFINIQTAGFYKELVGMPDVMQRLWKQRMKWEYENSNPNHYDYETLYEIKAGLYVEFSKIVAISLGKIKTTDDGQTIATIGTLEGDNEILLLTKLIKFLNKKSINQLCGHNIKDFILPFILKRMIINKIENIPNCLKIFGKKTWDISCIDTMELWKGTTNYYTSLDLLAEVLELPLRTSELDMNIHQLYWNNELEKIIQKSVYNVQTTINLILRLNNLNAIDDLNKFEIKSI